MPAGCGGPGPSYRILALCPGAWRPDSLTAGITLVILSLVKTAVSLPDRVFDAAERVAKRLGISRSELYARAVARFVEEHRGDKVTEALDRVYAEADSKLGPAVVRLQAASLPRDDW